MSDLSLYTKHYRPLYIPRRDHEALVTRAGEEGISKEMLINRYVREGLEHPYDGRSLPPSEAEGAFLVSDGVYFDGKLIEALENRTFVSGRTTAELLRRFVAAGLAFPPKPQAVTRMQEIATLKENLTFFQRRAIEAAKPYLETAAKIRDRITAELLALQKCCLHGNIIELRGAVSVYGCPCSDIEQFRHATKAGLCVDCGMFEGVCIDASGQYRRLAPKEVKDVGYNEFARLRAAFREFIRDR